MDPDLTVRRLPEKQVHDTAVLHSIIDEALLAHVAVVRDGLPLVLPFACARDGDFLVLHGSTGGGLLRLASGDDVAVEITHLDGLVFARSLFESSMHYRSAVVLGPADVLEGEEKARALDLLSEHLMPGRHFEVRSNSRKEYAATLVLRVSLARASVKVSDGPADEPGDGESREVWAGVLPLGMAAGTAVPAQDVPERMPLPESVGRAAARANGPV
jgi:nitroimidazol reductase NimA-like FMN-containing flavoprotein (pyridoxamine 5'-phosphate oxidase superfamily)